MWEARQRQGWTLRKLADQCAAAGRPTDHGHLGRIERGEVVPGPELRRLLARLLELDAVDDFARPA